ncbi:MAG: thiamine pyrophosphate-dependent enzyme [bacterium]
MVQEIDFKGIDSAWCPGCGDFGILNALKKALVELGKTPEEMLFVSGIGQAAKLPHYIQGNVFNGLHGRALPAATGAKIANPKLNVIVTTGDGDCYGEGGNHFINAIRRNINITLLVHNNGVYGLTKGQASPTSQIGMKTKIDPSGVTAKPFQPLAAAIALGCGFAARSFAGDLKLTVDLIKRAIQFKGFSFIDIFQPCPSFNPEKTFQWYTSHTYPLLKHDPSDKIKAFEKALDREDKMPLGLFYYEESESFLEQALNMPDNELIEGTPSKEELYYVLVKQNM